MGGTPQYSTPIVVILRMSTVNGRLDCIFLKLMVGFPVWFFSLKSGFPAAAEIK